MTAPPPLPSTESRLAALAAARDSSLPIAVAALVQIADDHGQAQYGSLAVTYREEFLWVRAQVRGGTGLFSGKPPYVWISNQIGNTGVLAGFIDTRPATSTTARR